VFFCALFVLFAFTKTRGRRLDVSVESLLKNRKIIDFKKTGGTGKAKKTEKKLV